MIWTDCFLPDDSVVILGIELWYVYHAQARTNVRLGLMGMTISGILICTVLLGVYIISPFYLSSFLHSICYEQSHL